MYCNQISVYGLPFSPSQSPSLSLCVSVPCLWSVFVFLDSVSLSHWLCVHVSPLLTPSVPVFLVQSLWILRVVTSISLFSRPGLTSRTSKMSRNYKRLSLLPSLSPSVPDSSSYFSVSFNHLRLRRSVRTDRPFGPGWGRSVGAPTRGYGWKPRMEFRSVGEGDGRGFLEVWWAV